MPLFFEMDNLSACCGAERKKLEDSLHEMKQGDNRLKAGLQKRKAWCLKRRAKFVTQGLSSSDASDTHSRPVSLQVAG